MQQSVRWGVIGVGAVADKAIAPAINRHDRSRLSAVVGRDLGRAQDFARRHGASVAFDDVEAMLAMAELDAVYVASPNSLHAGHVTTAARAGKHVLCDKPLATNVSDARHMVAVCERSGVGLGVMFQARKYGGTQWAVRAVRDGAIGDVSVVEVSLGPGRVPLEGWHADPALAGAGVINNAAVHLLDLLRFVLDAEVIEAAAMCHRDERSQLDVGVMALLRFDTQVIAYVSANQSLPRYGSELRLYGSHGRLIGRDVTRSNRKGSVLIENEEGVQTAVTDSSDGHYRTLCDFVDAVLAGAQPSPAGLDGLRMVELVEALGIADTERRVVRFP